MPDVKSSATMPGECRCLCALVHPEDAGVCEPREAAVTWRVDCDVHGTRSVPLCVPCAGQWEARFTLLLERAARGGEAGR